MLAGGATHYIELVKKLMVGDKVFASLSRHGYVGLGEVTAEAVPLKDFTPAGQSRPLRQLDLKATIDDEIQNDPERWDMCVAVHWIKTVGRDQAVRQRPQMGTLNRIRRQHLVDELLKDFGPATPGS